MKKINRDYISFAETLAHKNPIFLNTRVVKKLPTKKREKLASTLDVDYFDPYKKPSTIILLEDQEKALSYLNRLNRR